MIKVAVYQRIVILPRSVSCQINNVNPRSTVCFLRGAFGQRTYVIPTTLNIKLVSPGILCLTAFCREDSKLCGTHASVIYSIGLGLNLMFIKYVELRGLGFRLKLENSCLELLLGYSHTVRFQLPTNVITTVLGTKSRVIALQSHNREVLGQVVADIRNLRLAGAYKEKGVYEKYEKTKHKAGKKKRFS